ncbi:hypothetical protein Patl1_22330 [Pistacia atlantica]|uniref:Uncharacterized protein n=1 Tax=Pistacia atlantica TaxID=434234 RepID=A0ACC0ZXM7_9ROSI|nr:hypothetical protein Patl1_22330 [Pistacia atlantica]
MSTERLHCGQIASLPKATIVSVSRPDTSDISPMLLSYTIELQYKQFKWCLRKKASQVLYLHFAVQKRAIIDELHEKQEQFDHVAVVQDADEPDDGAVPVNQSESVRNRYVPSSAALSILRPSLGRQPTISEKAKVAMQGMQILGGLEVVICTRIWSKVERGLRYGEPFTKNSRDETDATWFPGCCFGCSNTWHKVWAVLKPGSGVYLAKQIKESNPLCYAFKVSCGNRTVDLRTTSNGKVKEWIGAINDAGLRPHEGWCHPHRFGSFAPPRGLTEDGSQAQWFIDGQAAFEAIASAIEDAKSEIFITGWWLCPELYMRRPFHKHSSSRLDALIEAKAKQGVQIYILLYKEVSIALKINSMYSKKKLLQIHENVRVLRYPDHLSTWSHHEKLVIIDYRTCFIGGLDLCFGRYDTPEHRVRDLPSFHVAWKGLLQSKVESEPNSWEDTMKDELDREQYPRMPWHDVHCALWGPPCRDVARHFVQRWNHAKRNKAPHEQAIPLLIPHHHMVIPRYMGSQEIDIASKDTDKNQKDLSRQEFVFLAITMGRYPFAFASRS